MTPALGTVSPSNTFPLTSGLFPTRLAIPSARPLYRLQLACSSQSPSLLVVKFSRIALCTFRRVFFSHFWLHARRCEVLARVNFFLGAWSPHLLKDVRAKIFYSIYFFKLLLWTDNDLLVSEMK